MVNRCLASNAEGEPCQAQPVRPSGYCYWHDPSLAEERDRKRREGGVNRSNRARTKKQLPAQPLSTDELLAYLSLAFKGVLAGKVRPNIGNCLGALARSMAQLRETSELEERLSALERAAGIDRRTA
jgi:hypothetical protein